MSINDQLAIATETSRALADQQVAADCATQAAKAEAYRLLDIAEDLRAKGTRARREMRRLVTAIKASAAA